MIRRLVKGLVEVVVITAMLLAVALPLTIWKVIHEGEVSPRKLDPILVPAPAYEEMEPVRFEGSTAPIYYKRFYPQRRKP